MKKLVDDFFVYLNRIGKIRPNTLPPPRKTPYYSIKHEITCPVSNTGRNYALEIIFVCCVNKFIRLMLFAKCCEEDSKIMCVILP
jgi:hypothetical protein